MESNRHGWIRVESDVKTKGHQTPLLWATREDLGDVVWMLLNTGLVDPGSRDWRGISPLCWAAANGHVSVVRELLSYDVRLNSPQQTDMTLLIRAAMDGYEENQERDEMIR